MRSLAALFALAFFVAACDSTELDTLGPDSEPVASDQGSVALPLTVGNEWTYRVVSTNYSPDGTPSPSQTTSAKVRVTGTVEIEGETWYTTAGSGEAAFFPSFLANRADGLYARGGSLASGYGHAVRIAAYPAAVGTQFGISYWDGDVNGTGVLTLDQDATLKRTDLPFTVDGADYEGYFFTVAPQRFRLSGVEYRVDPLAPSQHHLLIPDVGYGQYEAAYYAVSGSGSSAFMRRSGLVTMTLVSFTLAEDPG